MHSFIQAYSSDSSIQADSPISRFIMHSFIQADSSDSSIQADSSMPEGGGSGGTKGNSSGGAPLENKNAAGRGTEGHPSRGAPFGNTNAAGHGAPLDNNNAAGRGPLGDKTGALGNKNAAKKGLGVRIAAFAAKHGPPAYVAADRVLKKNAENDELPVP